LKRGKKTKETTLKILELADDHTVNEISQMLGISYERVAGRIHYFNKRAMGKKTCIGKRYDVAKIARELNDFTMVEVAKKYNVTKQMISRVLKCNGYSQRWIKDSDYEKLYGETK